VECGSVEVLLSPTEAELPTTREAVGDVPRATRDNVETALEEWAALCDLDPDDVAVLYLAGHGTDLFFGGGYLLLEGHGKAGGALAHALNIDFVQRAMSARRARTNFYFVDACRFPIRGHREGVGTSGVEGMTARTDDPRVRTAYKVFYGAAPDQSAWTLPEDEVLEHGTVFAKVLIRALNTDAADLDDEGRLCVDADRLTAGLARGVEAEARAMAQEYGKAIAGSAEGVGTSGYVPFHWPKRVPVELEIELDPATAAAEAEALLLTIKRAATAVDPRPVKLDPHPTRLTVDSGKYRLQLNNVPRTPQRFFASEDFMVLPSATHWRVEVEYVAG
jgi:hypothetical protein